MTHEERELLEIAARNLLKLEHGICDRVAGIEAVLEALFRHHGNADMALARLMVQAELLTMKRWYRHDYSRQSPQMGGQAKAAGRSAPGF